MYLGINNNNNNKTSSNTSSHNGILVIAMPAQGTLFLLHSSNSNNSNINRILATLHHIYNTIKGLDPLLLAHTTHSSNNNT